jgi:nucleotide-binding universal stress UspA family protein
MLVVEVEPGSAVRAGDLRLTFIGDRLLDALVAWVKEFATARALCRGSIGYLVGYLVHHNEPMVERILIGFDGSDGGRDALELARVVGSDSGASAVVATVISTGPLAIDLAGLPEEEATEAEPTFEEARAKLGGLAVETRAFAGGSPGAILTALAEREEFDVVVVGSPHRGALGRVLIGNVGASLLSGSPRDVAVAPKGYAAAEHDPFRSIAVGYDGTPEAKLALRRAEELARPSNAMIRVLTVAAPPVVIPGAGGYAPTPASPEPDKVLNEALESIDTKLGAERRRLSGSPAEALGRECEEGVDLLVLGSRGYGPLARVLLGSVSRHVIQMAACPVWVVPRVKGEAAPQG